MKFLAVILLLLAGFGVACGDSTLEKAHKATHEVAIGDGHCSATAIGHHALILATHCEQPTDEMLVAGIEDTINIKGHIRDGADHSILLVDATFDDYADVNLSDGLAQGEDVFFFGNPGPWQDILRKGYVAGTDVDHSLAAAMGAGHPDATLLDFQSFFGDSGAGLFNSKGEVIGVLSQIIGFHDNKSEGRIQFTIAFKLQFTAADLARARAYDGK